MSEADPLDEFFPVYQCCPGEEKDDPQYLIGKARNKREAAKLIREETGDPAYRASDVYFSVSRMAFFAEE